ncbi:unnamed protein product [Cuscuta europaea]|uniref:Strictosidine synthase conserved region domain-containing protein n=1 Tax=Cuscuta europaea TaxID=41803 RepID=A0A9P1E671_CUSEU|nr:unnamed protein product [Cuscuta europaea]
MAVLYIFLLFFFILNMEAMTSATLEDYHQLNLPTGVVGPESLAFDCNGQGPYTGVSDGRILRWNASNQDWVEFAITSPNRDRVLCDGTNDPNREPQCGRPLGLKFHPKTCELYITDAYFGLMRVGSNGGIATQLANSAQGTSFKFLNDLDIHPTTGIVFFTDSSLRYQRRDFLQIIINGDSTGRLLRFDPTTTQVSVLYSGLAFPNGIVLSRDNTYLLVVESTKYQILKFPLTRFDIGVPYFFAKVDMFPDNIRRNGQGNYWVAMNTLKVGYFDELLGVLFDENGRAIQVMNGDGGDTLEFVSEIEEHNGRMWFGSPIQPYVGTGMNFYI